MASHPSRHTRSVWPDRRDPTRIVCALLAGLVGAALGLPPVAAAAPAALFGRSRGLRIGLVLAALAAGLWGSQRVADIQRHHLTSGPVTMRVVATGQPAASHVMAETGVGEPVLLHAPGHALEQGAAYLVRGRLQPLSPEVAGYYAIQGARFELRASDLVRVGRRGGGWGVVDDVHRWMLRRLGVGTSPTPQRALVAGIAIGESGALPQTTRDQLRASGLYHLVAVSGQNVALLMVFVLVVLGLAGVIGGPARLAGLIVVSAYVLVTGAGPSIVRAGVAGGLVCAAWLVSRPAARWHLLAVGAVVVLTPDPLELWDPGFQLSFAAVVAIFAVAPRLSGWFGQTVAVSVACSRVTAPIVWWDFGRISVWSVPANLLVAAVVAPILWLAVAAMLLGALWAPLAVPLLALADLLSAYLLWVARACS